MSVGFGSQAMRFETRGVGHPRGKSTGTVIAVRMCPAWLLARTLHVVLIAHMQCDRIRANNTNNTNTTTNDVCERLILAVLILSSPRVLADGIPSFWCHRVEAVVDAGSCVSHTAHSQCQDAPSFYTHSGTTQSSQINTRGAKDTRTWLLR